MKNSALVQIETRTPPGIIVDRLQTGTASTLSIDVSSLLDEMQTAIRGEVRFSDADRGMYASDASNYRMLPLGVIIPRDAEDVEKAIAICRRHGAPVFARGGGTGIPGQTVNNGVLFDFSKYMNQILGLNESEKLARVEPGVILDSLRNEAEKFGLTFGPDPATHSRCTLGGMIGNNSCGAHSVMAGTTADNIDELEILLYDGTRMRVGETSEEKLERSLAEGGREGVIYRELASFVEKYAEGIRKNFPDIPRRVSGYNLPALLPENGFHVARSLVGTECTCVIVLEATAKLVDSPPKRSLLVIGYSDIFQAADNVTTPMPYGPIAIEALDDSFIKDMKKKGMHPQNLDIMPEGHAWLLVEFGGGSKHEADDKARKLIDHLEKNGDPPLKLFSDDREAELVWNLREEGLGATAKIPGEPENHEGWEDSAVPPERLGLYLRDLKKLFDKYGYYGSLYGHFGQGCVHTRLNFDLETAGGIDHYKSFLLEAADLVVGHGGSLSGEHGDGQARGELLPRMFDDEIMQAFREFKQIWDPDWKMNPGKLIDPFSVHENLRLGKHFQYPNVETEFEYPDDRHNFAVATERCVGAGVCRRISGGVMCPSYMVTLEEKHSTRGRARLLNEMIRQETIDDGWASEDVREALDLCLSCKGCKGECPVQVDIALYKAEFLAHYYKKNWRPRTAWTMGRIHRWASLASLAPSVANYFSHSFPFEGLAKWVAGVHPERTIPAFAPYTFKSWFEKRNRTEAGGREPVILWPDTFNNYFHPNVAQAAVEVLETAGFQVAVPRMNLCCGRPLYDWGFLNEAKQYLRDILDSLKDEIENGTPLVVLEPSCASVFKEELLNFFPNNENAKRLAAQTYLLGGFVEQKAPDVELPELRKKALVHPHCHHRSIFKMDADEAVLKRMQADFNIPDSGCCGMAGAFGFEKDHYDIAMKCGERVLLPAVRELDENALIITDGFSCGEQIKQATGRESIHLAQAIRMAMNDGANREEKL